MSENGNGNSPGFFPRYARVREVARKLEQFTPGELADELEIAYDEAEGFIGALLWQGLLLPEIEYETDEYGDQEPVYTMEPMPDTIYKRNKYPPCWLVAVLEMGGFEIFNARGIAVRIRSERDKRKSLSTPGARQHHKNADREYWRQQEARRTRSELSREMAVAQRQGKQYEPHEKHRKGKKAGRKTK